VEGRIVAAAAAEPVGDEAYWAGDAGAFVRRAGEDQPLRPTAESLLVDVNLELDAAGRRRASDLFALPAFWETFQPRVVSSTLSLAWVAAGRHAAYLTEGDLSENVHFAAGIGVCHAAGCTVTDLDGVPLVEGEPGRGLLAAADAETHGRLLALVAGRPGGERGHPQPPKGIRSPQDPGLGWAR
jgi:myo-inositol-1(or 4)-monophosphatase